MRLKRTFIIVGLLTCLGSSTTPILTNNEKINNDTIIVNDKRINLRQKSNIKKANSSTIEANIETTNVDYDLRYLYGGKDNYTKYNIWDLVPNINNSKETTFKFLCAKPVGSNLYLYVYHNDNKNSEILGASFKISTSKTQNQETGEFEENYSYYNTRLLIHTDINKDLLNLLLITL